MGPHKRGVPELYGMYSKTLRVYSTEIEKLKEAINDFARYLHDRADNTSYAACFFKPSKAVRTDQSIQCRGDYEFRVDCSRSQYWLMVRFGQRKCPPTIRPLTVVEKERDFPIYLSFTRSETELLWDMLREIDLRFFQYKFNYCSMQHCNKMIALEQRIKKPSGLHKPCHLRGCFCGNGITSGLFGMRMNQG